MDWWRECALDYLMLLVAAWPLFVVGWLLLSSVFIAPVFVLTSRFRLGKLSIKTYSPQQLGIGLKQKQRGQNIEIVYLGGNHDGRTTRLEHLGALLSHIQRPAKLRRLRRTA